MCAARMKGVAAASPVLHAQALSVPFILLFTFLQHLQKSLKRGELKQALRRGRQGRYVRGSSMFAFSRKFKNDLCSGSLSTHDAPDLEDVLVADEVVGEDRKQVRVGGDLAVVPGAESSKSAEKKEEKEDAGGDDGDGKAPEEAKEKAGPAEEDVAAVSSAVSDLKVDEAGAGAGSMIDNLLADLDDGEGEGGNSGADGAGEGAASGRRPATSLSAADALLADMDDDSDSD